MTEGLGALSEPVSVDLASVFCGSGQTIKAVQEVSLSANQKIEDVHHWRWRRRADDTAQRVPRGEEGQEAMRDEGTAVVIRPLTTRTFVVLVDE